MPPGMTTHTVEIPRHRCQRLARDAACQPFSESVVVRVKTTAWSSDLPTTCGDNVRNEHSNSIPAGLNLPSGGYDRSRPPRDWAAELQKPRWNLS